MPKNRPITPRRLENDLQALIEAQPSVAPTEEVDSDKPSADEMMEEIFNEDTDQPAASEVEAKPAAPAPATPVMLAGASTTASKLAVPQPRITTVRVKTKEDHHCRVGGTVYYFKKGVVQNVPENVRNILNKGGLLLPV